jgi:ribosomal protein S18 acetylase RimI-like enzyme
MPSPLDSTAARARLAPFAEPDAATILGWARDEDELELWAAVRAVSSETLRQWHAEPGVHPFVLWLDGARRGYGEIWEDHVESEAELARVIVDPEVRGQGIGRILIGLLVARAREHGWSAIWLRVVATNAPAIACYRAGGFVRADHAQEAAFNDRSPCSTRRRGGARAPAARARSSRT